jgi:TonB family protein
MAGQNSLRVLWATMADSVAESPCRRCSCRPDASSLPLRRVVEPDYPETALESGVRGTVVIEALVDREGFPDRVRILRGHPTLAAAAFRAISQWRWEPPSGPSSETVPIAIAVNFEPE